MPTFRGCNYFLLPLFSSNRGNSACFRTVRNSLHLGVGVDDTDNYSCVFNHRDHDRVF